MPKWINKSGKPVDVVHNGRKIRVGVNGTIEGPNNFNVYSGFEILTEVEVKKQTIKTSFKLDKPNVFNAKKKNNKYFNKHVIIPNNEFTGMVTIPNNPTLIADSRNNHAHVDAARNFITEYKTNGTMPSVAICILSKNSYDLIRDCVDSIGEKVMYPNTSIYVFDTGTDDVETLKYYRKMERSCKFPFKVLNVGKYHFSSNYNNGIKLINADYVLIQNNDTKAVNDYISKLMKVALIDKVGLSGPRMLFKDGRIQHDGQHLYDPSGTRFVNPGHVNVGQPAGVPGGRHIVDGITAAGVLVRKSWYDFLKGFDNGFRDIYQDVHFCMSNQMHGKISVCDRDSVIYHYDNTSRKKLWVDSSKVQDMARDHNHLFNQIKNGDIKIKKRNKYNFSIITLINNKKQYFNLLDSLRKQLTSCSFEVIAVPNFNNEYKSCAEGLNAGIDVAEGQYHIYCHQDIHFDENWIERINQHIINMNSNNIKWGILGIAGAARTESSQGYGLSYLKNSNENDAFDYTQTKKLYGDVKEVDCLDELCLIAKASNKLRFDQNTFNHYHWYGADICLQSKDKGLKNFAIDAPCVHDSDGIGNLISDSNRKIFIEQAAMLLHKWHAKIPYFRTMTATFDCYKGIVSFFIASALKNKGVNMTPAIHVKGK